MKKTSIIVSLLAVIATIFSCTPASVGGQTSTLTASLTASESFTDGKATVNVVLSSNAQSDVKVTLTVDETAADAIKATALSFQNVVTVAAKSATTAVDVQLLAEPNGPAKAYFKIVAASGAKANTDVVSVSFTPASYSEGGNEGGNEGGEEGGVEGGNEGSGDDVTFVKQTDWTVQVTGTELESDDDGYYIAAKLTAPGSTYIFTDCFFDDEDFAKYGGESLEAWASGIEGKLAEALKSYTIDELLYQQGDIYLNYYDSGDQYVYVIDFDANGNLTGKYAIIPVTLPELETGGGEFEGELTFCKDWKAEYVGDGEIDVTGVTDDLFMFDIYEAAIPESDLAEELQYMVDYNLDAYGYYYEGPEDYDIWEGLDNGQYYVYIAGINTSGVITGNYGYSIITVSDVEAGLNKAKLRIGHARNRHHRGIKIRKH